MPPEPLPWERKEFFLKERRNESGSSVARWRDRDHTRWGSPADFRSSRPPGGHGKQGGWHMFNEEPSHGYGPSRSGDENGRMPMRMDGRYGRNGRDNRGGGSYYNSQRDWKGHSWETNNASPNFSMGRPNNVFPSVSAGRVNNGSPSISAGRINNGSPSISAGRVNNGSPSVSAGRVNNVSPSISAGRLNIGSPNVSSGMLSNGSPGVSLGRPSNVSPSVSAGRPINVSPCVLAGRPSNGLPCLSSGMSVDVNNDQRLVDDALTPSSHPPPPDFAKGSDQVHLENQHDKMDGVSGLGTGQRCEKENLLGLDRKLRMWTRSSSLSSRGSGFSHSSSSKSMAVDSNEGNAELQHKSVTPLQSPSGELAACQASAAPSEDISSRKKPRLGWGDGLAKFEKKKTDGPDDGPLNKNGVISPTVVGFSDCGSPATPSSIACSSSPGVEDKSFVKAANTDNDTGNPRVSPHSGFQDYIDGFSINLEKLELSAVTDIVSSLVGVIHSDDQSSVDNFVRSTAMNKLLLLKTDILKTVEMTESEVDSLENELKSLKNETTCPCPAASSSLPVEGDAKQGASLYMIPRPAPLLLESTDMNADKTPFCGGNFEDAQAELKDDDIDSPGTATSKLAELPPLNTRPLLSGTLHDEHSGKFDISRTIKEDAECHGCVLNGEQMDGNNLVQSNSEVLVHSNAHDSMDEDNRLFDSILASNKEIANQALEVFNKLLPTNNQIHVMGGQDSASCQNVSSIRDIFARRKKCLRFKERAITLKFRALKYLWKEDIRLLSSGRSRAKPHKRLELHSRILLSSHQKNRSSIRTRFSSPAGHSNLVPTSEIVNYTGKLLLDSQMKLYRNTLKMPALILDEKEKVVSRFVSSNGLVEDPCAVEKERTVINPWTSEEKDIFMDKLALFGKDFRKIASFLDHKTTADCVEFYYKNHKSDCFEKTKKKADFKKQGKLLSTNTYLVTSGKKWNWEMNAASLDMLGAASAIAARVDDGARNRQTSSGRFFPGGYNGYKTPQDDVAFLERPKNIIGNEGERETVAADVLAGICGSLSSEAMSSCITSSVDPGEGYQEWKCKMAGTSQKQALTPEVTQNADDETCSDESCGEMDPADWTDEEKSIFIQAVASYGKDFGMISRCVKTRSRDQCKIFFSKARKCLGLDLIHPGNGNIEMTLSDDATGGGSDTDNACTLETGSVICSEMESKQDKNLPLSVSNLSHDESCPNGSMNLQTELNRLEEDNGTVEMDNSVGEAVDGMLTVGEVVENVVIEEGSVEDRPISDDDSNTMNDTDKHIMIHVQKSAVVSSGLEAQRDQASGQGKPEEKSMSAHGKAVHPCHLQPSTMVDIKVEVSTEGVATEPQGKEPLLLPKKESEENNHEGASAQCSSVIPESQLCRSGDLHHSQKHPAIILQSSLVMPNPMAQDAAVIQDDKNLVKDVSLSTVDSQEIENKQCQKSADILHNSHHLGHPLLNHVESLPILGGYPLQTAKKKEMNGDVYCGKPTVQSLPNSNSSLQSNRYMALESYLQKCKGSKSHCSVAEHPFLSQSLEHKSHHNPRSHSRSSSDPERPSKHGDVKLFGQILSHPSSLQKPNSSTLEKNHDSVAAHQPKLDNKSFNLKFSGHHSIDGSPVPSKFDRSNCMGLENLPMSSYGFWDGSRIQTGFSSLPDSAVLLAKYPAAFSSYGTSSSKIEHQPFQEVVKSGGNDHNTPLNGVSVFPTRDIIHGGRVQPFTVEMQQHQDMFSELQRQNGFEAVSSLQQQGRGLAGINVVGRGGILVGGSCPAISDPVAAIKMHYAKTDQFGGGQGGSIIREDESWRGNVDIDSR